MERYWVWEYGLFEKNPKRVDSLNPETTLEVVKLADAQATVEALQRENERLTKLQAIDLANNNTFREQVASLTAALDAELEKVKAEQEQWEIQAREGGRLKDKLTQLQAAGNAMMKALRAMRDNKESWYTTVTPELMNAWDMMKASLGTATLDATTPAPDTSIIGKCEPPAQWDPNAQIRGDIS